MAAARWNEVSARNDHSCRFGGRHLPATAMRDWCRFVEVQTVAFIARTFNAYDLRSQPALDLGR